MAESSTAAPAPDIMLEGAPREGGRRSVRSVVSSTEIDLRLIGMFAALFVIWISFHVMSGGTFLTPRNLWNLSVQTASVAIMATGMVLIIVSRNIDLSVGSMLGLIGVAMGLVQAEILPGIIGFDHPLTWLIALGAGLLLGALLGGLQGFIVAYIGVPAFLVTLGALLLWRGVAWALNSGQTVAPMDSTFQLLGGGARGSVGEIISWIIGLIACLGIAGLLFNNRRQRRRFGFPLRPLWGDVAIGVVAGAAVLAAIWVANNYFWPSGLARQYAIDNGIQEPPGGLLIPTGIANPVLIAIGAAIVMSLIATRRRFGRYVFAIGGNPEAAELGGINTRWTILKTFVVMGVLVAIAAAVSTARLNAATSAQGTLSELYVIAAAVIGGTSLSGGIGTIPGAVLGAVVMQSLQSGMVLIGVDAPIQDIVVGIVLVAAVALDTVYRRRLA